MNSHSHDDELPPELLQGLLEAACHAEEPDATRISQSRGALLRRVQRDAALDSPVGITMTRHAERHWEPLARGVERCVLTSDGQTETWLARLAPGASLPPHRHLQGDEESMVLEGSCYLGATLMQRGDYQLARQGSSHGEVFSPQGCILFLRSPVVRPAAPQRP